MGLQDDFYKTDEDTERLKKVLGKKKSDNKKDNTEPPKKTTKKKKGTSISINPDYIVALNLHVMDIQKLEIQKVGKKTTSVSSIVNNLIGDYLDKNYYE